MSERTLVVLGASSDQLFLVRTAKRMGLRVLALDMNPDSVAFAEADDRGVVSTRDVPALIEFLEGYRADGRALAGVITMGSDIPDVVSALGEHFGLPHMSKQTARLATDKYAMKVRLAERGVPVPWFSGVANRDELERFRAERGRLVLKPVDRSGSRGVFLLDEDSDVGDLLQRARDFSYSGRVQVEEFLPGLQISTETLLWRGRAVTPGFADRNYELLERFAPQIMENGGWIPSSVSPADRRAVESVVERAALALGIENGVAKGDVVLTPEGPKIIEIAARLSGGDFCESLVPLSSGVNYVEAAIRIALGEEPDWTQLEPRRDVAVANRYLFPEPGRLIRVEGEDQVRAQPFVEKLERWYEPGDEVPPVLSHAHRFGVFVVTAPDRDVLEERVQWVYDTLKIVTEPVGVAAA